MAKELEQSKSENISDKHLEVLKKAKAFDEISNVVKGYEHHLKPHESFDHKDSNEVLDIVLDAEREDAE